MDKASHERTEQLEALLIEYVERYGLTPDARAYFIHPVTPQTPANQQPRFEGMYDAHSEAREMPHGS